MLEVCVDSFESAEAAVQGGANRIELCSALSEGGLTPSIGLLRTVKSHFPNTKVFAMLRPHGRISYQHTDADMEILKTDIDLLIEYGADGFVFGALTSDRDIDVARSRQIVKWARGLPVTFHRAFDMSVPSNKFQSIYKIVECGFSRLLSSGLAETAEKGLDNLTEINKYISERDNNLILMPGCGVTTQNAENILRTTGCKEFHSSAKDKVVEDIPSHQSDTNFIKREITNNSYTLTNRETVQQLVNIGKSYL